MAEAIAHDGFRELCHDARQSLATIMLLATAGKVEARDPEQVVRRLEQIAGQTRWMASLLDDVLCETEDDLCIVDVSAEVAATVKVASAGFAGTVRLITSDGAHAVVSPARLRRAFANILHNAVRAAGDGGCLRIRVLTRARLVIVDVEDNGPGFGSLPTEHGIGLSATRRVVESFGGTVQTGASALGGALVRVALPSVPAHGGGDDADPAV